MELSIRAAACDGGEQTALLCDGRGWSYAELADRVAQSCAELLKRGVRPGMLVALSATNRVETLICLLAFIEMGIPFVPIHPRWTEAEVDALLADAQPSLFLRDPELAELTATSSRTVEWPQLEPPDAQLPLAILYTSGTTGVPKGAVLTRSAFVASAKGSAKNLGWRQDDRWLLCLPLCHIGGLSIVTRCLVARRALILLPRYETGAVLAAIDRDRATLLSVVPTMLQGLLESDREGALRRLRAILVGGAATPWALATQAVAQGANVLTTYGLTEACSQVTVQPLLGKLLARRGSGVPLAGVELAIVGEDEVALPAATVGRISVRGEALMSGYLHRPPLAGRWFDTGDLGELDAAGTLSVHTRRADLIVTGGENVYPIEVEQALCGSGLVARALVFGVPDDRWGAVVAAAIVPSGSDWNEEALFALLRQRLAPYKQPRLLCVVDSIPELASGKPDRRRAIAECTPLLRRVSGRT